AGMPLHHCSCLSRPAGRWAAYSCPPPASWNRYGGVESTSARIQEDKKRSQAQAQKHQRLRYPTHSGEQRNVQFSPFHHDRGGRKTGKSFPVSSSDRQIHGTSLLA